MVFFPSSSYQCCVFKCGLFCVCTVTKCGTKLTLLGSRILRLTVQVSCFYWVILASRAAAKPRVYYCSDDLTCMLKQYHAFRAFSTVSKQSLLKVFVTEKQPGIRSPFCRDFMNGGLMERPFLFACFRKSLQGTGFWSESALASIKCDTWSGFQVKLSVSSCGSAYSVLGLPYCRRLS